jgi:RHS repeat-associated protein
MRLDLSVLGCLVGAALIVAGVSPAWAAAGGAPQSSAVVGGFGLGDGLEASIDEQSGAFRFALPAGGLNLGWDSRALGADQHGIGAGWGFGLASVRVDGGVQLFPASGGVYFADASSPSGLAGYTLNDLRFEQRSGRLPARDDGLRAEADYAYVLHELGGLATYFDAGGSPIASIAATSARTDWVWAPDERRRLAELIDADGVVTSLTWQSRESAVLIRPGANLPGGGETWSIELADGRVGGLVDPEGGRIDIRTDASGLVTGVSGLSGATTEVSWRAHLDGVPRVERVIARDADGAELSARTWQPADDSQVSSRWPLQGEAAEPGVAPLTGAAGPLSGSGGFETVLADRQTEVESTYNALGSLIRRVTTGSTAAGRLVLREQAFEYPGTDDRGVPTVRAGELPKHWARPTAATTTLYGADGAQRAGTQRTEFDEFGRLVAQTGVDGIVSSFEYDVAPPDSTNVDATVPPMGLRTSERSVAPDGLVTETRYELNRACTAVIAETAYAGHDGAELAMTGRTEYTVEEDGFVSERRVFPAERAATAGAEAAREPAPRVTRWQRAVDMTRGVATLTQTVAPGTELEASASSTVSLVHGGVLEHLDPLGRRSSAVYDRLGRVSSATDPSGRTTTTHYETAQADRRTAVTVTGPDGVATTQVSDELGRVLQITDNVRDGEVVAGHTRVAETRDYPAPGQLRRTDAWGAVSSKRDDVFGRTVETIAPTGLRSVTVHDDVSGSVTNGATPTGDLADAETISSTAIDAAGRVTSSTGTRRDGVAVPEIGAVYDGLGRQVGTTGGPFEAAVGYDALGRPAEQTLTATDAGTTAATAPDAESSDSRRVHLEFDEFGTPVQKTVSDGTSTYAGGRQAIDALGRTFAETDQAGTTTTSSFAADGLVTRTESTTGQVTTFDYDDATRALLTTTTSAPGRAAVTTEREYDPVTGRLASVFDPADRAGTEQSYTYDAFGNVLTVTFPDGAQLTHEYDEHGRHEATIDIAGNTTTRAHDQAGLLTSVVQTAPDGTELASAAYTYDDFGRLASTVRGNGVTTSYDYTSAGELLRETTVTGTITTVERAYTYDAAGRLTQRIDRTRDTAEHPLTSTTTTYAYDAFGRLTASTIHDGDSTDTPVATMTWYRMTVAGDVASETVTTEPGRPGETTIERAFEYTPAGALTSVTTTDADGTRRATREYDASGNLTRDLDGTAFAYDAADRVIERTGSDGSTTRTGYWPDGARRQLETTGQEGDSSTVFYWDGDALLNDAHAEAGSDAKAADRVMASYLIGVIRHARTVTGGAERARATSYLGTDRHGNTTDLTDERGAVTTRYAYTDYGTATTQLVAGAEPVAGDEGRATGPAPTPTVGDADRNPFQYASEYADPSGRLHLDAREYDAHTMRFDTPDVARVLTNYAYGDLNPIMNVDPSGRSALVDHVVNGLLIGAAVVTGIITGLTLGLPTGGAGAIAAWSVGFTAVLGDLTSSGIAIAQLVDDSGLKRFIRDDDREALRIAGYVVGAASAVAGPLASVAKSRFAARAPAAADDVVDPAKPWKKRAKDGTIYTSAFLKPPKHTRKGQVDFDVDTFLLNADGSPMQTVTAATSPYRGLGPVDIVTTFQARLATFSEKLKFPGSQSDAYATEVADSFDALTKATSPATDQAAVSAWASLKDQAFERLALVNDAGLRRGFPAKGAQVWDRMFGHITRDLGLAEDAIAPHRTRLGFDPAGWVTD